MSKFDRDLRKYFQPIDFSSECAITAGGSMTATGETIQHAYYIHIGFMVWFSLYATTITTGGTAANSIRASLPSACPPSVDAILEAGAYRDASSGPSVAGQAFIATSTDTVDIFKEDGSNYGLGSGRLVLASGWYITDVIG